MSRSYRKQPVWKDHNKGMKEIANRKVRRALNQDMDLRLPHKDYKKYFCSYDICDYRSLVEPDFERYYQEEIKLWQKRVTSYYWCRDETCPTRDEAYKEWITKYRGK
ncbi:MAG: hypothetical protein NC548_22740 [Lachnospiraceae bacterium]|nr:hypothetical protein [Lachnospiraceae bacterium]